MSREGISYDDPVDNAQVFHLDQKPVLRMVRAAPPDPVFAMDGFLSNHPVEATRFTCLLLTACQQHYAASAILQLEML